MRRHDRVEGVPLERHGGLIEVCRQDDIESP
jgi:hypothetical protein